MNNNKIKDFEKQYNKKNILWYLDKIEKDLSNHHSPASNYMNIISFVKKQIKDNFISKKEAEKKWWKTVKHNVECYNIEVLKIINDLEEESVKQDFEELKNRLKQRLKEVVKCP